MDNVNLDINGHNGLTDMNEGFREEMIIKK